MKALKVFLDDWQIAEINKRKGEGESNSSYIRRVLFDRQQVDHILETMGAKTEHATVPQLPRLGSGGKAFDSPASAVVVGRAPKPIDRVLIDYSQPDGIGPHEREFGHMPCWDTNPAHHKQCTKCCTCKKKK